MGAVVYNKGDLGECHGLTSIRAIEDDILFLPCSDGLHRLLTENPLHGIDDIRLAAAIRPYEGSDAINEINMRSIGETLEAIEF